MARFFLISGALAAALAVMIGAFGAHSLEGLVSDERLATFETGVQYHFYHAIALCLVGLLGGYLPDASLQLAGWLFLAGIVLFSGSLYILVTADLSWLGMITPFGGLAFIAGWIALAWQLWRSAGIPSP